MSPAAAAGQNQGRSRRATGRTLDPGGAPPPPFHEPGRTQPSHRRTPRAAQPAPVPQALGLRASLFESLDRPVLQPLPVERYEFAAWKTARVNIDYHIEVERHYYSVPYQLVGQRVEVRLAARTVESVARLQACRFAIRVAMVLSFQAQHLRRPKKPRRPENESHACA